MSTGLMVSTFGWLDTDPEERRRMLSVVDLFKEKGTLDELGFGSIRDAFADILFPGTTTIHTRLKYVLFVPWLLRAAARGGGTLEEMSERFAEYEVRLIDALVRGGEGQGVIGREARGRLQRTPTSIYIGAMTTWGVANVTPGSRAYFRRQVDLHRLTAQVTLATDDPESRAQRLSDGFDPSLPPPPTDLLTSTKFDLDGEQRTYLIGRIIASVPDSMLAWLLTYPPANVHDAKTVWDADNVANAPEHLGRVVDHARRFSAAAHGASLTYHYHLTALRRDRHQRSDDQTVTRADEAIKKWEIEHDADTLRAWTPHDWDTFTSRGYRITRATRMFVDEWLTFLNSPGRAGLTGPDARQIVERRERMIKGGRARFANRSALDRWDASDPPGPLTFRWPVARRHLNDLTPAVT